MDFPKSYNGMNA